MKTTNIEVGGFMGLHQISLHTAAEVGLVGNSFGVCINNLTKYPEFLPYVKEIRTGARTKDLDLLIESRKKEGWENPTLAEKFARQLASKGKIKFPKKTDLTYLNPTPAIRFWELAINEMIAETGPAVIRNHIEVGRTAVECLDPSHEELEGLEFQNLLAALLQVIQLGTWETRNRKSVLARKHKVQVIEIKSMQSKTCSFTIMEK